MTPIPLRRKIIAQKNNKQPEYLIRHPLASRIIDCYDAASGEDTHK